MNLFTKKEISMMKKYIDTQKKEVINENKYSSRQNNKLLHEKINSLNNIYSIICKNNHFK